MSLFFMGGAAGEIFVKIGVFINIYIVDFLGAIMLKML